MQSQPKFHRVYVLLLLIAILLSGCAAPAAPAAAPASGAVESAAAEAPAAAAPASESARPAPAAAAPAAAPAAPSSHRSPTPVPYPAPRAQNEPVTAGVVDDNEQWNDYLDYRARHDYLWVNERDISERITAQVWDGNNEPVHDATVEIYGDSSRRSSLAAQTPGDGSSSTPGPWTTARVPRPFLSRPAKAMWPSANNSPARRAAGRLPSSTRPPRAAPNWTCSFWWTPPVPCRMRLRS